MSFDPREPTSYDLLATSHVGQRVVRLWVRQETLKAAVTITEGMTVTDFVSAVQVHSCSAIDDGYGSYILTEPGPTRDGSALSFHFAPPNTSTVLEGLTPWSEKTIWLRGYDWPDVLRYLYAVEGKAVDHLRTQSGANQITDTKILQLDRFELVKGGFLPTQCVVRRYQTSDVITGLVAERPVAQPVTYAWNGLRNTLLALHDDVRVPEALSQSQRIPDFGTENAVEFAALGEQFFPRTNFLTWRRHISDIEQSDRPVNGLYQTVVYEVIPPTMPQGQILGS